jgi:hypothetical protein
MVSRGEENASDPHKQAVFLSMATNVSHLTRLLLCAERANSNNAKWFYLQPSILHTDMHANKNDATIAGKPEHMCGGKSCVHTREDVHMMTSVCCAVWGSRPLAPNSPSFFHPRPLSTLHTAFHHRRHACFLRQTMYADRDRIRPGFKLSPQSRW